MQVSQVTNLPADLSGIGKAQTMAELRSEEFIETIKVNALGPLVLFQAVHHLLKKANGAGKFVVITSAQGSIADMIPGRSGAYGVSKAAVNALSVKLQEENQDLVVFSMW